MEAKSRQQMISIHDRSILHPKQWPNNESTSSPHFPPHLHHQHYCLVDFLIYPSIGGYLGLGLCPYLNFLRVAFSLPAFLDAGRAYFATNFFPCYKYHKASKFDPMVAVMVAVLPLHSPWGRAYKDFGCHWLECNPRCITPHFCTMKLVIMWGVLFLQSF